MVEGWDLGDKDMIYDTCVWGRGGGGGGREEDVPILKWGITFFPIGNLDVVLPDLQPPTIKVQEQDIFNINKEEWLSQTLLVGP